MAEKKVIIFVKSHQHYEGAEPEDMELISEGLMDTAEDGTVTLAYEETEHYQITRAFLQNPQRMLRELLAQ